MEILNLQIKKQPLSKVLQKNKGFSLVELMVVVAIIGILASIAVPNFQRFQSRARQSEVKTNLGGFYQAAKASQAEYSFYPGNLPATGWQPEGQLRYIYLSADESTDCSTAAAPTVLPFVGNGCDDSCINTNGTTVDCPAPYAINGANAAAPWVSPTALISIPVSIATLSITSTATQFNILACGNLSTVDCWTIDQSKSLNNIASGI